MYAKIFTQIFDSSIAENYEVRHVYQDLLILADKTGSVDMTYEAVARRTNVPIEKVKQAIDELLKPDPSSRSKDFEGRRLIPIDSRRDWGWVIVNYEHYRAIQDEEAKRATWRNSKAQQRARKIQREKNKATKSKARVRAESDSRERRFVEAHKNGESAECDRIASEDLPERKG